MADMQKFGRRPPRGGRGLKLHSLERELLSGAGRPPRGGRGLKFHDPGVGALLGRRPPRGGRGLKSFQCSLNTSIRPKGRPPRGGRGLKSEPA